MTTFSQLVDELVSETKRPDMRTEIATYLNQTIREVHFEPSRGNVAYYRDNRREEEITATAETGETWELPNPAMFQGIECVRFASVCAGNMEFVDEIHPGPEVARRAFFWYRAAQTVVFGGTVGYGGVGGIIQISYFEYPRALKYKDSAAREATYDSEDGWTYNTVNSVDYNSTPELQAEAEEKTSNWLLLRWADVLREGLRAKIYKRLSDQQRAQTSYSLYMQLRQGLYTSEVAELTGA